MVVLIHTEPFLAIPSVERIGPGWDVLSNSFRRLPWHSFLSLLGICFFSKRISKEAITSRGETCWGYLFCYSSGWSLTEYSGDGGWEQTLKAKSLSPRL
jgi:hypothetical protein